MSTRLTVTRDVTPEECPWLQAGIAKGTTVYAFHKHTYGCIGNGRAVTFKPDGDYPFFELPHDALLQA